VPKTKHGETKRRIKRPPKIHHSSTTKSLEQETHGNSHLTSLTIVKTIVARMPENPNSSLCRIFEGLGSTEAKNWRDNILPSKELSAFPAEKMQQAGNRRFPADGLVHV